MEKQQATIFKTDKGDIRVHILKTWTEYYDAITHPSLRYRKTFEIRKFDRDYRVGDYLWLHDYNPEENDFTGRQCFRLVTYLLDKQPFVSEDYVVMALMEDVPSIEF
jgi:hypothetical protein